MLAFNLGLAYSELMSTEQISATETLEWKEPIAAHELMEDFKAYTQWLIDQGLAFREDDVVLPMDDRGLGRAKLLIEYLPERDEISKIYVTETSPVGFSQYQVAFKYTPRLTIAEFKATSFESSGKPCECDWFFSRIRISPADAEFSAFMNAFAQTIERNAG